MKATRRALSPNTGTQRPRVADTIRHVTAAHRSADPELLARKVHEQCALELGAVAGTTNPRALAAIRARIRGEDVADRRAGEEAVRAALAQLQAAIKSAPDAPTARMLRRQLGPLT